MKEKSIFIVRFSILAGIFLFLSFTGAALGETGTETGKYRLAVVAVTNQTGENVFSDMLIIQGMANLLAQDFFDSGLFVPVEDNPEILSRIKNLLAVYSQRPLELKDKNFDETFRALACDAVTSATLVEMNKSRLSGFSAIFSGAKTTITIKVRVELKMPDGHVYEATGEGEGVTKAVGAFFQIRNDQVAFDKTTVGRAVKQAIAEAVKNILEQL